MLSAIKVVGACFIILAVMYGLIAIVFMLLIRIKEHLLLEDRPLLNRGAGQEG